MVISLGYLSLGPTFMLLWGRITQAINDLLDLIPKEANLALFLAIFLEWVSFDCNPFY